MTAKTRLLKTSAALVAVIAFGNIASAQTLFVYDSSPYSYELQGESGIVTPADGTFGVFPSFGSANAVTASINASTLWTMIFAAPNGALLSVGSYPNAGNTPSTTNPWIGFGAFGRKCNQTGSFNVLQIDYGPGNTIASLAVDFVVYDFGVQSEWSRGSFRYNSAIPVPEPSSILLYGLAGLAFLALQKVVRNCGSASE
jgi:hypothetical protein